MLIIAAWNSLKSTLPKWTRRLYVQIFGGVVLVYLFLSFFYVELRTFGIGQWSEAGRERIPTASQTWPQDTRSSDAILKQWKTLVANVAKPINESSETWVMQEALLFNDLRRMKSFRKRLTGVAKANVITLVDNDLRNTERRALSFMNNGNLDALLDVSRKSKKRQGIVVTAGNSQYRFLLHLLSSLRSVVKSTIPVEVFYRGPEDLSKEQLGVLTTQFGDVTARDLLAVPMWNETELALHDATYQLKIFALLSTEFAEPILCDNDAVFFQDPRKLYDDPGYMETGTLFYHDRFFLDMGLREWLKHQYKLVPELKPSLALNGSKYWNHPDFDSNEQDSGVVLINKNREDVLFSLSFTAWMNGLRQRTALEGVMFGEKETFWLGFELTRQPYSFAPLYAGAAGKLEGDEMKVDNIFHFDRKLKPMWMNGGVQKSKHMADSPWLEVDAYGLDDGIWSYGSPLWTYSNATWVKSPELGEMLTKMTRLAQEMDDKYHPKIHL